MSPASEKVISFFKVFEKASNEMDLDVHGTQYADTFIFAGPTGTQPVKKDDFLKVLPKRYEYFKSIGLSSSRITDLEETRLDEAYTLVKVFWEMVFENNESKPTTKKSAATYILHIQAGDLRIVFQLDHQDLTS